MYRLESTSRGFLVLTVKQHFRGASVTLKSTSRGISCLNCKAALQRSSFAG